MLFLAFFFKGDRGLNCEAAPYPPLTPQPLHALQLIVLRTDYVNAPQRMRQRYAYGSNIAAVRCGWEDRIMGNSTWENCNLQSGAVLWLRHSFARAFSGDSVMLSEAKHLYVWNFKRFYLSVIARGASLVAIKRLGHLTRLIASLRSQ